MDTDLNRTELQQNLQHILDTDGGLTKSAIARAIGISVPRFTSWMNNKYTGDSRSVDGLVQSYLIRHLERKSRVSINIPFIETSAAKKIFEVARLCHLDNEIGVLVGGAGEGKTWAVKEYNRQNMDTILIESDQSYTAKVVFGEIASRLNQDIKANLHELFEGIVEQLKGTDRLIIVDEAEHLPYRALELLRRLYDKAEIGILFIGMPKLISNLRGKSADYKQLYSRVGVFAKLDGIKQTDTESVVALALPDELKNGNTKIWQSYHKECRGNMRTLVKLIARTIRIAELNKTHVNESIVKAATETLII